MARAEVLERKTRRADGEQIVGDLLGYSRELDYIYELKGLKK